MDDHKRRDVNLRIYNWYLNGEDLMLITSALMVARQHFPNLLVVDCHCLFPKNDIITKSEENLIKVFLLHSITTLNLYTRYLWCLYCNCMFTGLSRNRGHLNLAWFPKSHRSWQDVTWLTGGDVINDTITIGEVPFTLTAVIVAATPEPVICKQLLQCSCVANKLLLACLVHMQSGF